jgi:3-hydroxyacyl-[acyl-carrier protein] dehydratase/trans-2-decenoyl-[acyl-carrier protein] isomerase
MIVPTVKKLTYHVHMKRVILRAWSWASLTASFMPDGVPAFEVLDMKVGLFRDNPTAAAAAS